MVHMYYQPLKVKNKILMNLHLLKQEEKEMLTKCSFNNNRLLS